MTKEKRVFLRCHVRQVESHGVGWLAHEKGKLIISNQGITAGLYPRADGDTATGYGVEIII